MPSCLIGLGSNLGNRAETLQQAVECLKQHPQTSALRCSSWHETPPIGGPAGQASFLNAAAVIDTTLSPHSLLEAMQQIESRLGRRRRQRWGPRTIDLDLLLYGDTVLETPPLVLPHPSMAWRRFVLEPAVEVAAATVHPIIGWTIARLLEHLDAAVPYVAITGGIGVGKTHLAAQLSEYTSGGLIAEELDLERLDRFYADPASHAWATELEFVEQRTRLLAADSPRWSSETKPAVSDFWFDQSLAFARVWLPADEYEAYRQHWAKARAKVVRPKLIVLLDAPAKRLHERVRRRGRRCERNLTEEQLQRIRRAVVAEAAGPDHGPVLKLSERDPRRTLQEVTAALEAMQ